MPKENLDILIFILLGTLFIISLLGIVMMLSFRYQKRKMNHRAEVFKLQTKFQQELLETQIEVQNATLQHVGRELHDNIGQLVSLTKLHTHTLEVSPLNGEQTETIHQIESLLSETLHEVRQLTKSLDGDFVKDFGFLPSLENELNRIEKTKRIKTSLTILASGFQLGYQSELILFRIMQEIFQNTLKHAWAKHITVTIQQEKTWLITVQDDGKGFNLADQNATLITSGAGLRNIRRRAELIGFQAEWFSKPGEGTLIQLTQTAKHEPQQENRYRR